MYVYTQSTDVERSSATVHKNQSVVSFSELLKDSEEALFEITKEGTEVHWVRNLV